MTTSTDRRVGILLGASSFPAYAILGADNPAFKNSAAAFRRYMLSQSDGLGIPAPQMLDLFDHPGNCTDQLDLIRDHLSKTLGPFEPRPRANVFMYYVGHGILDGYAKDLALALRDTRETRPFGSSMPLAELGRILRTVGQGARKFFILDCCFSGMATGMMTQGPLEADLVEQLAEQGQMALQPAAQGSDQGLGVLTASDDKRPALTALGDTYTMFSDGLFKALSSGNQAMDEFLTLAELRRLTHGYTARKPNAPAPGVYEVEQNEGRIVDSVRIFPNPARRPAAPGRLFASHNLTSRIVHLSDPHFGLDGTVQRWRALAGRLAELEPKLLLITGDIVDAPSDANFALAREELDRLQVDYVVCPGNNDRYAHEGEDAQRSNLFERHFSGHVVPPDAPDLVRYLQSGAVRWKIALITLDSSGADSREQMQGAVSADQLDAVTRAVGGIEPDTDVCIVMQHHRLLPSAVLETRAQEGDQAAPGDPRIVATAPARNAGRLLEAYARNNVNIVLHGHEHRQFASRYAIVGPKKNEVVIIAAASATGTVTDHALADQASFNVLEFRSNHTIWLQEHLAQDEHWREVSCVESQLYSSAELRLMRINRLESLSGNPGARLTIHYEINRQRDIYVRRMLTDYPVPAQLEYEIFNSTSMPVCTKVLVKWADSTTPAPEEIEAAYVGVADKFGAYKLAIPFAHAGERLARSLVIDTVWQGGALLTADDFRMFARERADVGDFRKKQFDYVRVAVKEPLEMLTLVLSIPQDLAPAIEDMKVIAQPLAMPAPTVQRGSPAERREGGDEFGNALPWIHPYALGRGDFIINIPYPLTQMRFGLAWRGIELERAPGPWTEFSAVAAVHASRLLTAFKSALAPPFAREASFALYLSVHGGSEDAHWSLLKYQDCTEIGNPGGSLHPHSPRSMRWICWWGELAVARRDGPRAYEKGDLCSGEEVAVFVPVRPPGSDPHLEPVAMVRIGYKTLSAEHESLLRQVMGDATTLLLNQYINLRRRASRPRVSRPRKKPAAGKRKPSRRQA